MRSPTSPPSLLPPRQPRLRSARPTFVAYLGATYNLYSTAFAKMQHAPPARVATKANTSRKRHPPIPAQRSIDPIDDTHFDMICCVVMLL